MSCCQVKILPNESEIIQLRSALVQARWEANLYKSHHLRNVEIRERVQYEHDSEIWTLKQKCGWLPKLMKF